MTVKINIKYNIKDNYYHLEVKDGNGVLIPYVTYRVYESEFEADIAAGIIKMMYAKVENRKEVDANEVDFNIRAVFRLIDAPGKW
jgi:hypothetical protein